MRPELAPLARRLDATLPAAVRAGAEAVADEARSHAGPLAPGIVVVDGHDGTAAIESHPVPGQVPPVAREFGTTRTPPAPYMRPVESQAPAVMGRAISDRLAKL